MRRLEICRKNIVLDNFVEKTLVYYITIDDIYDLRSSMPYESYGVGISLGNIETREIYGVTFSCDKIISLANLLSNALVTPVTLCDIVSDWLCL